MEAKDMTATARALGVVELLELIILHVQPDYIVRAKRVSRMWYDIIQQSSKIQGLIKCHAPISGTKNEWEPLFTGPIYAESPKLAIHPALDKYTWVRIGSCGLVDVRCKIYGPDTANLHSMQQEFATRPFCQTLHIFHAKAFMFICKDELSCNLRMPGGITIGHVLRACQHLARRWDKLKGEGKLIVRERTMAYDEWVKAAVRDDFAMNFQHVVPKEYSTTKESLVHFDTRTGTLLRSEAEAWYRT